MNHWTLYQLDIIGFASTLESPNLPRVLAPVFRVRDQPDLVLLPPFSVLFDEVFNVTSSNSAEFEDLVAQQKLTRLAEPFVAKLHHELWVNVEGLVAYSPKGEVKKAFDQLFKTHLAQAEASLAAGDYASAGQHAAIAHAAKPANLAPLVIRATAERLAGELSQFAFTRHLASDYVSPQEFDQLVAARTGNSAVADTRGSAVMNGIATRRPRFAAA